MARRVFNVALIVFAILIAEISSTPIHFQFDEDTKDSSSNSTLAQTQEKTFTYFVRGFDYENRPVVVMPWGSWDLVWLVKHPELQEIFEKHYDGYIEDIRAGKFAQNLKAFSGGRNDTNDEIVIIVDFDGFQFRHVSSLDAIKFVVYLTSKLEKCYAQISYGFVINANPLAFQTIILSKPTAGNFLGRMEIFGTNSQKWIPKMHRMVPPDQLPPAYGGPNNFETLVTYNLLA